MTHPLALAVQLLVARVARPSRLIALRPRFGHRPVVRRRPFTGAGGLLGAL